MLMRTDPFRELDRFTHRFFDRNDASARPAAMPMDAYRHGDELVVTFDLPGVDADSIDLEVQRNVLTVRAERRFGSVEDDNTEVAVCERPRGALSRQLFLADASFTDGLLRGEDLGLSHPTRFRAAGLDLAGLTTRLVRAAHSSSGAERGGSGGP